MTTSLVRDNTFIGLGASLFYINNALVSITKNSFTNNGLISSYSNSSVVKNVSMKNISNFEFFSYTFSYMQQYGIF